MVEYHVVGRRRPTPANPNPTIMRMSLFAKSAVEAKNKFFYFSSRLKNLKKANGEILACSVRYDTSPQRIKNFGVFLRYNSRSGTHNMYKEYRDLTRAGAVSKMLGEMAGTHRARRKSIQIIKVDAVPASKARREGTKVFLDNKIKFPLPHRVTRVDKAFKKTFVAARPSTHAK